jgi:hypothetical protein
MFFRKELKNQMYIAVLTPRLENMRWEAPTKVGRAPRKSSGNGKEEEFCGTEKKRKLDDFILSF